MTVIQFPGSASIDSVDSPLEYLFTEIENAQSAGLYYLAIAMILTVPDICAALESENGETSGAKYKAWYNLNLGGAFPSLTDTDCYMLRCGVLHQGRMGHPKSQYARVIFTIPTASRNVFHNNIINDALNLDVPLFCKDVINAARRWYKAKRNEPQIAGNIERLVQLRPNGLSPYIVGTPIIS